jgi:hypothetical protein
MTEIVRNMDSAKARMSDGAAHESDLVRSGEAKVGDILSAPVQESVVFLPKNRGSDAVLRHHRAFIGPNGGKYCDAF